MNQQFYGWKLLAVLWVIMAASTGFAVFGASIMNTYMMTEMQLDRKSLGLAFASMGLCMGLISPLVGYSVQRWGARMMLSIGTLLAALAALAMATVVSTLVHVVIVYGLIMGCAIGLGGTIPAQTLASYWFRRRLALAMTIILTGGTIGGFVATPLLTMVTEASGGNWRMGWFVVAAVCAVAFLCALFLIRNKPADLGQVQDGVSEEAGSGAKAGSQPKRGVYRTTDDWTLRQAIWHKSFWLMVLGVISGNCALGIMLAHGVAHFKDLGHSPTMAAMFISVLVITGLVGKGIFAICGDRVETRFLWSGALMAIATGMALVVTATSEAALYATALLIGAGASVVTLGMFTMAVNYFGKSSYASIVGVVRLMLTLFGAITQVLTGMAFDHLGSYAMAFYPIAALCIVGGLVMPFVVPSERPLATARAEAC